MNFSLSNFTSSTVKGISLDNSFSVFMFYFYILFEFLFFKILFILDYKCVERVKQSAYDHVHGASEVVSTKAKTLA